MVVKGYFSEGDSRKKAGSHPHSRVLERQTLCMKYLQLRLHSCVYFFSMHVLQVQPIHTHKLVIRCVHVYT